MNAGRMDDPDHPTRALTPALRDRRSSTVFDPESTLSGTDVEALLRAAQWAPSGGNMQPWAWFVLPRGSAGHQALVANLSDGNVPWVPQASAVFVAAAQIATDPDGNGRDRPMTAAFDTGLSTGALLAEATARGLATRPFAGFNASGLAEALGVPAWFQLMCGVAVGTVGDVESADPDVAEKHGRVRVRKELSAFVFGDRFGEPYEVN